MKDFIVVVLLWLFAVAFIGFAIAIPFEFVRSWQCNNYQEITGRESKYIFFDACYVKKEDGSWIRYDSAYKE